MVEKDVSSLVLMRTPKSQLTAEQLFPKILEPTKKYPTSKDKEEATTRWGGIIVIKSNPYLLDGCLTNWKTIIPQKFSHRSERMSPMSGFPALRSGNRKRNPQRICL